MHWRLLILICYSLAGDLKDIPGKTGGFKNAVQLGSHKLPPRCVVTAQGREWGQHARSNLRIDGVEPNDLIRKKNITLAIGCVEVCGVGLRKSTNQAAYVIRNAYIESGVGHE